MTEFNLDDLRLDVAVDASRLRAAAHMATTVSRVLGRFHQHRVCKFAAGARCLCRPGETDSRAVVHARQGTVPKWH